MKEFPADSDVQSRGADRKVLLGLLVAFVLVAAVNIPQAAWLNLSGALLALGVVGAVASGVMLGRH